RVACGDVPEPNQRRDIPGIGDFHFDALVRLDHHDAADALAFPGAWIVNRVALLEHAAVNAEEHKLADKWIGPKLEGQRAEFGSIVRGHRDWLMRVRVHADGRWN